MNHNKLRLECLRLADACSDRDETVLDRARKYADFVLGTKDAGIVQAAEELAKKVRDA